MNDTNRDTRHCEGPAVTSDFSTIVTPTHSGNGTAPTNPPEAGAAGLSIGLGAVAAGFVAMLAL
jgi:hypothetical protein